MSPKSICVFTKNWTQKWLKISWTLVPGCTAGCIKGFENEVGRRFITELKDEITKSPRVKEIIGTTLGILKILAKFIDLIKDLALSIVMLEAVGGFQSVWAFKTNFSSIIIITMFSSILIPLFMSTLHLIVNRRKIIDEENFSSQGPENMLQ